MIATASASWVYLVPDFNYFGFRDSNTSGELMLRATISAREIIKCLSEAAGCASDQMSSD
jgi:hypothetical protein